MAVPLTEVLEDIVAAARKLDAKVVARRDLEVVELGRNEVSVLAGHRLAGHRDGRGRQVDLAEARLIIARVQPETELAGLAGGLRPARG